MAWGRRSIVSIEGTLKPILAVNCGSSSLKCAVIDVDAQARLLDVRILELGSPECRIFVNEADGRACRCDDVAAAMGLAIDEIDRSPWGASLVAVGHRIVHGGAEFSGPLLLDEASIAAITKVSGLAPLHNTPALAAVRQRAGDSARFPTSAYSILRFTQPCRDAHASTRSHRSWRSASAFGVMAFTARVTRT